MDSAPSSASKKRAAGEPNNNDGAGKKVKRDLFVEWARSSPTDSTLVR